MSKAVLVMDMPESCFGCNFLYCNADAGIDSCQAMEVPRIVDSETYESQIGVRYVNCRRKEKLIITKITT